MDILGILMKAATIAETAARIHNNLNEALEPVRRAHAENRALTQDEIDAIDRTLSSAQERHNALLDQAAQRQSKG